MAFRRSFDDLVREGLLWFPLDWHRVANVHSLPLFVFLSDGRGARTFATDVGIERLVRSLDPKWDSTVPGEDWRKIIALFLDPLDVTAIEPPRLRWNTAYQAPGPLTYATDDGAWVVEMVDRVKRGFSRARIAFPSLTVPWGDEVIGDGQVFLVGVGSGASLALQLLQSAVRPDGSGLPLFSGAAILGGTVGGQALNDPARFPAASTVVDAWPPTPGVALPRLLSIVFDASTTTDQTLLDAAGTIGDNFATPLVPLPDAVDELTASGFDPLGADATLTPQVRTHGCAVNEWATWMAAQIWPYGLGGWVQSGDSPLDPSGVPVPVADVYPSTFQVLAYGYLQVPVTVWECAGLPPGVWPSLDIPQVRT